VTKPEYIQFFRERGEKKLALTKAKNDDYSAGLDPFANFTRVEALGICSTEQGFLVRMTDKMSRIASFLERGELSVKEESVDDTLMDLSIYADLMAAFLESKKRNAAKPQPVGYTYDSTQAAEGRCP
jgi:hypothetical protein